jgi:hypothetical protein
VYEPDSEEGSFYADLTSSINNSAPDTETDGTVTPIHSRKYKVYSDLSDDSNSNLHENITRSAFNKVESTSLTESEYFSAQSVLGNDSTSSSSIWK